ncbi:MAG: diaminopimelate decarboxylase [Acidimicrobiaceae bacterium]|nr:diaminopimelate decarboxylase [Acidimicrobiaceae bacterium]MYG54178.1 diaminopimelate decarboxylase [Acidimicrobiaceae bacterium]MYJ97547.1 diaminopimelate decarboxylase [Acidimicrobiaceae bacterium]
MSPFPFRLLPDSAELTCGQLRIGGCGLLDLANEYGTPLFVYDEQHLRDRCREAVAVFGDGVAYATKAFLCTEMARLAYSEGMHLDVATGGELHVALSAGVPADRLVMHGNNKSMAELAAALEAGVGRIVVDSFDELDRLDELHASLGVRPKVLLRLTPGIKAETHEFVATGHDDTKFGFTVSTGDADAAIERARASSSVELVGVHAHIGSQVFALSSLERTVAVIAEAAAGYDLPEMSVGGGLGVAYVTDEWAPTITEWGEAVIQTCTDLGVTARVLAEPGRSIAAAAAVTLYEVGTIKRIEGVRTYVSVDGGMSDNPRPVLYGSGYEAFLPRAVEAERPMTVTVVGKHCESGDLLVRDAQVPADLEVGDILATAVTGAYGHSMGSNYNKVPRPPVVFVAEGVARLVVRRETFDDLTRLDL